MDTVDNLANIRLLRSQPQQSVFVMSVLGQFERQGSLSQPQWDAIARIADDIRNPKPKVVLDFAAIIALFTAAADHLKYPKVRLALRDLSEIVLSRAGQRARQPGTINVTNGGRFGEPDNRWFGRIGTDGAFQRARDCTDEVAELLVRFSGDPAGVATAYGKLTGNCCFCGRSLSDARSTDMGYGPVCARNFGLVWGNCDKAVA